MAGLFYQANFCAECGNVLELRRRSLWPRYFCDDCDARLQQGRQVKPLAALLLCAIVVFLAFATRQTATQIKPAVITPSAASVSALDATARQRIELDAAPARASMRVLCGARTRKGTPCRHRVWPGQRCAQHRGKPSMLKQDSQAAVLDAPKPVH